MGIFIATPKYIGDPCYLCPKSIELKQKIVFLGGLALAHSLCMKRAMKDHFKKSRNQTSHKTATSPT